MKIFNIIKENLPKNKWKELGNSELEDYKEEIYKMIDLSYSYIGGYPGINSPNDIDKSKIKIWKVIDVDGDQDPDAVSMEKQKPAGRKLVGGATDGSKAAKRAFLQSRIDYLKKSGYYVEASHKIAEILEKAGVPIVKDPEKIKKVLNKPDVEMIDAGRGLYQRTIQGRKLTKQLFGNPR